MRTETVIELIGICSMFTFKTGKILRRCIATYYTVCAGIDRSLVDDRVPPSSVYPSLYAIARWKYMVYIGCFTYE